MVGFEFLIHVLKTPFEWYELKKQIRELEHRVIILEKVVERLMNHPELAHLLSIEDIEALKLESKNAIERKYPQELPASTYKS